MDSKLGAAGLLACLCLHAACWTLMANIAGASGTLHHDMTETLAWGREFQLGYAKHPPVFAWLAGAWFLIFERADWAFHLLSAVSAAGGLAGVWYLAGRLLPAPRQTAAVLLVILAPFFGFMAMNFNANAILLLVWPWTAYAFVRSLQTCKSTDGIVFGVIAALAIGSKYSTLLLLASCLAAALLHPRARIYFASPAPYAAIVACLIVVSPHVLWVLHNHLTTVAYVLDKEHRTVPELLTVAGLTLLSTAALNALPLAALFDLAGGDARAALRRAGANAIHGPWRWLGVLAFGPFLLTFLAGLVIGLKVSTGFLLPAFFAMPIALIALGEVTVTGRQLTRLWTIVTGWLLVALATAPMVAVINFALHTDQTSEPRREIALEATRLWHEAFGVPVKIAGGSAAYGLAVPFYGADAPRFYILATPIESPWITPELIARDGLLIVCEQTDGQCLTDAQSAATPATQRRSVHVAHTFLGWRSREVGFELFLIPPRAPVTGAASTTQ